MPTTIKNTIVTIMSPCLSPLPEYAIFLLLLLPFSREQLILRFSRLKPQGHYGEIGSPACQRLSAMNGDIHHVVIIPDQHNVPRERQMAGR